MDNDRDERVTLPGCDCRAYPEGDAIHVVPCCPEHGEALERAANRLGEQLGIPVDVIDDGG